MPVKSVKAWGFFGAVRSGKSNKVGGPSPEVAKEMMDKTPGKDRSKFAKMLAKNRKH